MRAWIGFAALIALVALSVNTAAQDKGWGEKFPNYELLGERKVDFGADKDTIEVTGKEGRFVSIMIGVVDGNVEMYDIEVTFGNDETYSPGIRHEFKQGERSRQIDLPGEARVIKKVTFKYKSKLKRGKATVKLFGKPADAGDKPDPDKPGPGKGEWMDHLPKGHEGYHLLGTREVRFGADRDVIEVTASEGRFVGIVLGVVDGELEMFNIKVEFGNGEEHSPDVRANFDEKSRSRVIDLPGEARVIKKVVFFYKSKLTEGRATVKLFGKPAPAENRYVGFKHLGSREVDLAKDTDVLVVGASKGSFKGFMIEVENADLEMKEITITMGNGKQYEPKTRFEFKEDSRSRVIDFPGNEGRTIERIEFKYSTDGRKDGKAKVNVYGRE